MSILGNSRWFLLRFVVVVGIFSVWLADQMSAAVLERVAVAHSAMSTQATFQFTEAIDQPQIKIEKTGLFSVVFSRSQLGDVDLKAFMNDLQSSGLVQNVRLEGVAGGVVLQVQLSVDKARIKRQFMQMSDERTLTLEIYHKDALIKIHHASDGPLFTT